MQYQHLDPPEALRDIIQSFWYLGRDFDEQQATFEIVPDSCAEIIFYVGGPLLLSTPTGWQPLTSPFLVGLLRQPVIFRASSRVEILGVKCFPWAVLELLGLPLGKDGVRAMAHPIAQLQAPLTQWLQAGNVAAALAQLAGYFGPGRAATATGGQLTKAGGALRTAAGPLPVAQLAAAAHTTVRTLERQFKRAAGRTLKDVAGLLRFEQTRRYLWRQPTASLAELAQELGYADQSHLGREFKRYCGTTPAAFARQAAHWQKGVDTNFVAFILSYTARRPEFCAPITRS